jgi:hypothetical protein
VFESQTKIIVYSYQKSLHLTGVNHHSFFKVPEVTCISRKQQVQAAQTVKLDFSWSRNAVRVWARSSMK